MESFPSRWSGSSLACAAFLAALCSAARAPAGDAEAILGAGLLPGWRTEAGSHIAALHLQLAPGWKTYWRSPGEAGLPPVFDWERSENLGRVEVHWPRPRLFDLNGLATIGYDGAVVLPVEIWPAAAGASIAAAATVHLGVCRDICVPVTISVAADLPGDQVAPDARILAALSDAPENGGRAGAQGLHCRIEPDGGGLRLTAEMTLPRLGGHEVTVIETTDPGAWVGDTLSLREGGRLVASSMILPTTSAPLAIDRDGVTITILSEDRAVEIKGCPAAP
jgi:DsbC/DsbD-like thiol-disulfide interchange protein